MSRIQKMLKGCAKIELAVALLRASREVWPEGEVFGGPDIRPEEELLLLRELFYADLPGKSTHELTTPHRVFSLSPSLYLCLSRRVSLSGVRQDEQNR